ncbi:MAG: RidA family protein [Gammaproteobacteria bacterium]
MPRKSIQPDTLFPSSQFGFAQIVTSEGNRYVHCAGQTSWDKDMKFIGEGDLARQMQQSLENVRLALAAGGATPKDVVRATIYVVDYNPEKLEIITGALKAFFDEDNLPANTLLGVQSLALPEFMVEIEVTAVVGG